MDVNGSTTIEYFDIDGASLGVFTVPAAPGNQTLSFLGVSFTAGERVSRVRIVSGNTPIEPNDAPPIVDVVMDDFIYGEPIPEPASLALLGLAAPLLLSRRRNGAGR